MLKMAAILDFFNLGPWLISKSIISANFLEILVLLSLTEPFFWFSSQICWTTTDGDLLGEMGHWTQPLGSAKWSWHENKTRWW